MRMIAGPNGSGKSTLLKQFEVLGRFSLGFRLNPDELEASLRRSGRLRFA